MGYHKVRINVKDQNDDAVVGAKCTLTKDGTGQGWFNQYTNSDGNAYFYDVPSDIEFMYKAEAPTGYTCVKCAWLYSTDRDVYIPLTMNKSAASSHYLTVKCETESGAAIQNAAIVVNNVNKGYTGSDGQKELYLIGDQQYDVKSVRDGYDNGFDSIYLTESSYMELVMKKEEVFVCAEGATTGYNSCPNGGYYYDKKCINNEWVNTGDSCPEEEPEPDPDPEPTGESAEIYDVKYPLTADKGDEFIVKVYIKNTGDQTCEIRCKLIDVDDDDRTIRTNPVSPLYKQLLKDTSGVIELDTEGRIGAMPDHDWNLRVDLIEVNPLSTKIHASESFTVEYNVPVEDEIAVIKDVDFPPEAYEGDELMIKAEIENIGSTTCEIRCQLIDLDNNSVINTEPDTYTSISSGSSTIIDLPTSYHYGAMPSGNWNLQVKLLEINKLSLTTQKTHATYDFTIQQATGYAEGGEITDVQYPDFARTGDEIDIICTCENPGSKTSEVRIQLYDQSNLDTVLAYGPKLSINAAVKLKPGEIKDITVTTNWVAFCAMPDRDWDLRVELWEYDLISANDFLDKREFTIVHTTSDDPTPDPDEDPDDNDYPDQPDDGKGKFAISTPLLVCNGEAVIKGRAPAGVDIYIMGKKSWIGFDWLAFDEVLAVCRADDEDKFSTTLELSDIGIIDVYGKIKKVVREEHSDDWIDKVYYKYFAWIPGMETINDWMAKDDYTSEHTIYVINYTILIVGIILLTLLIDKIIGSPIMNRVKRMVKR